jgi:hypothetical protein
MSYPELNPRSEAARMNGLRTYGRQPTPEEENHAAASWRTARLDDELRGTARAGIRLDDVQVGHIVGLLLSICHVPGDEVERVEADVRALVRAVRRDATK